MRYKILVLMLVFALALGAGTAMGDGLRWNAGARQFDLVRDSGESWLAHGRLCVVLADKTRISSDDARFQTGVQTRDGAKAIAFRDRHGRLDLTLVVRPAGAGALMLKATLANRGPEPLALERIDLLCGNLTGRRDPAKRGVLLSGRSMGTSPRPDAQGVWQSHYTLAVQSPSLATGFLTGLHNINRFSLTKQMELTAWGECNGALLPAGQTRETDLLFISARENPLPEMERFADLAAQINHAKIWPTNMATWCSWYSGWIRDRIATFQQGMEKGIEQNIAPVKKLSVMRDATARYAMRICEDSSNYGDWTDVTQNITHGLSRLARLIRAQGLVAGVWYTPYWVGPTSRVYREHPEWMGQNLDGSEFRDRQKGIESTRTPGGDFVIFDTSRPEVQDYFEQVARRWRERGFRYVSNDYLSKGVLPPRFWDRTKTKGEVFRLGMEATRRGLGDGVFFRAINALYGPCMGLVQDMRVGADSFGSVVSAYEVVGSLWFYNHRLWLNDPESIVVRGQSVELKAAEGYKDMEWNRMWASWIALSGAVMTFGDRLGELPPEYLDFYHRVFPPLHTAGRPLDLWENEPFLMWGLAPDTSAGLAPGAGDGPYELFGVFDLDGTRRGQVRLNLDEIAARCRGWEKPREASGEYLVWDFWNGRLMDTQGPALTVPLPSKEGRLFALRARLGRPQLIATNGHFSQGVLETSAVRWDAGRATLSGKARGNGGEATTLYFYVPRGMRLAEARLGDRVCRTKQPQPGIIAMAVPAGAEPVAFRLTFTGQTLERIAPRAFVRGRAATVVLAKSAK